MSDTADPFTRALVRMIQSGEFQKLLGCKENQTAAVSFHREHIYQVQLNRHTIVVETQDIETIRRKNAKQWQEIGPPVVSRNRIVLKRDTGKILQVPSWEMVKNQDAKYQRRSVKRIRKTVLIEAT